MKKKILIIGGAGYIGTVLCNYLVNKQYDITCVDTFWFGDFLDKRIKKIKKNINNFELPNIKYEVVINLAYLSNDPLCELDARLTWESGPLSTYKLLESLKKNKIKRFIFASSGSIYGLKKEKLVTEDLGLDPITDYNKSKMICEKVVESYSDVISSTIVRPATVCGYSPRLRLDTVLNMFCYQAYYEKKIKIFGGSQTRPLVHIMDMVRSYEFFINNNFAGCFNLGFENKSVKELAAQVQKQIPCKIKIFKSDDKRSYRISSAKIKKIGFEENFSTNDAILELKQKFSSFRPSNQNWNLKWLSKKNLY